MDDTALVIFAWPNANSIFLLRNLIVMHREVIEPSILHDSLTKITFESLSSASLCLNTGFIMEFDTDRYVTKVYIADVSLVKLI